MTPRMSLRAFRLVAQRIAPVLMIAILGSLASGAHADPADFQAMPGLWKMVIATSKDGHTGKPVVVWHCVDEGADPWAAFADRLPVPADCQRTDAHRGSTALAWNVHCTQGGDGRGNVNFDSPEHYVGSIVMQKAGEIAHAEGQRYAACTSPSD